MGTAEIPYGTLELLVLKALASMGPLNGYRVARRIEQLSENLLALNQGSIYPALLRLEQKGWISAKWGVSDTNRKVRIYSLTKSGAKRLRAEVEKWRRTTEMVGRILEAE
jgi:transcriptional regulator